MPNSDLKEAVQILRKLKAAVEESRRDELELAVGPVYSTATDWLRRYDRRCKPRPKTP